MYVAESNCKIKGFVRENEANLTTRKAEDARMTSNLKNRFEELARPKDPTMEEVEVKTGKWKHSGNSGGGHTGMINHFAGNFSVRELNLLPSRPRRQVRCDNGDKATKETPSR